MHYMAGSGLFQPFQDGRSGIQSVLGNKGFSRHGDTIIEKTQRCFTAFLDGSAIEQSLERSFVHVCASLQSRHERLCLQATAGGDAERRNANQLTGMRTMDGTPSSGSIAPASPLPPFAALHDGPSI
jgi:hypothetical protein